MRGELPTEKRDIPVLDSVSSVASRFSLKSFSFLPSAFRLRASFINESMTSPRLIFSTIRRDLGEMIGVNIGSLTLLSGDRNYFFSGEISRCGDL